jgi:recombination protein RecR
VEAFDQAVDRLKRLPGIGKKSAQRLVFHLLTIADSEVEKLTDALLNVKEELSYCRRCYGLSQQSICEICRDEERDAHVLAVVAQPEDVFTLEDAGDFNGRYHVLRGLISPLDGVGPEQLTIDAMLDRVRGEEEPIKEIIFAFNPTNEGEVTINYLEERLSDHPVELSHLGYGIPVGSDIEYTDQMTLSKAFENRVTLSGESSS